MQELLKLIPRPIAVALTVFVAAAIALAVGSMFAEMAWEPIAKTRPVSTEDIQFAARRLQIERLNIEKNNLASQAFAQHELDSKVAQANLEAHRQSLRLPPTISGAAGLESLLEVATKHLWTILAIMFTTILLPSFVNTSEPWRLALMISAGITLSGAVALAQGAMSPTNASIKVDVFSMSISSASIAVALASIGAVLTGVCIYMIHHPSKPTKINHAEHPANDG